MSEKATSTTLNKDPERRLVIQAVTSLHTFIRPCPSVREQHRWRRGLDYLNRKPGPEAEGKTEHTNTCWFVQQPGIGEKQLAWTPVEQQHPPMSTSHFTDWARRRIYIMARANRVDCLGIRRPGLLRT
ncbi:hypothetical protein DPEC_G00330800 [Dallia pectoralis]|uniref:Uncharacterized protein n=1 Tax=Dallia pectoralis TaxID=75939 RepID=A0ACC2F8W9_DALPE|nr:hypothetical protein DPEC_G00330800 [Dallia pectoralis]